jgi:hypothetical protein
MNTTNVPIVVGGCHRSGTSLVRRILNAHSRIYCGPEVKFFRDFYGDYFYDPLKRERFVTTARSVLSESELLDLLGHAFVVLHEQAAAQAGKARWADKNPENAIYLAAWERLLGDNWLFIHVVRNPLDTLASIKEVKFKYTIPLNLDARIAFYQRYVHAGLEFGSAHPERYRQVVYEELVSQPGAVLPALMNWLCEQFEAIQLEFNRVTHQSGLEDPKIRGTTEIHGESVGRWMTGLTAAEAAEITKACAPLWRQIDPEGKWAAPPLSGSHHERPIETAPAPASAAAKHESSGTEMGELSQLSAELAEEKFKMEEQRAAAELWAKELLGQIAIRDRELARIKNLIPVRAALSMKRALLNLGLFRAFDKLHLQ